MSARSDSGAHSGCRAQAQDEHAGLTELRKRVEKAGKVQDVKVTVRIAGGIPSQRLEEEYEVSGSGRVSHRFSDMLKESKPVRGSGRLNAAELRELLDAVARGTEGLVPRSMARFLPDTVVGKLTIEVGQKKTELYFLPDESTRTAQNKHISSQAAATIERFRGLRDRFKKTRKGVRRA
jgi:hypothetical protein